MDYRQILEDLISGKLSEYVVEASDAFSFQDALRNFEKRKEIVGVAKRNGTVVYRAL